MFRVGVGIIHAYTLVCPRLQPVFSMVSRTRTTVAQALVCLVGTVWVTLAVGVGGSGCILRLGPCCAGHLVQEQRMITADVCRECSPVQAQVPDAGEFDSAVPLRIRPEQHNSLNNRFKPDPECDTFLITCVSLVPSANIMFLCSTECRMRHHLSNQAG